MVGRNKLEIMYIKYRSHLYAIALSILENPLEAEDAIHDAIKNILNAEIKHIRNPKALLVVSVKNTAISILRRRGHDLRYLASDTDPEDFPACYNEIFHYAENRESKARLSPYINALSPKLSDTLLLRYYYDLSYAQIAQILSISEEAARKRVFDGLKIIRQTMESEGVTHEDF